MPCQGSSTGVCLRPDEDLINTFIAFGPFYCRVNPAVRLVRLVQSPRGFSRSSPFAVQTTMLRKLADWDTQ